MTDENNRPDPIDALFDGRLIGGSVQGRAILDDAGRRYGEIDGKGATVMFFEALDKGSITNLKTRRIESIEIEDGTATVALTDSDDPMRYRGQAEGDGYSINDPPPVPTFSGQYNEFCTMVDYYARDFKKGLRFDILREQVLLDPSLWRSDRSGLVPLSEEDRLDAYEMILNRLPKGTFESSGRVRVMRHPLEQFEHYCLSRAKRNPAINPFVEEWRPPPDTGPNTIPRYDPRYFLSRCGARSPVTDMDPEDSAALVEGLSAVEISTVVERMVEEDSAPGEVALLLFGLPGGGKSSISKALALGTGQEPGPYHKEMTSYPKDELQLYYATRGKVIVELEEGTGVTPATFDRLKGDITRRQFSIAGKWEIYNMDHPKRYTEIVTTNRYRGVPEDNRRICPLEVVKPDNEAEHAYTFPTDDMRAIYWNAWKGTGIDGFTSYEKGGRAHDVYKSIEGLINRARRITVQIPEAWEDVEDFAECYMSVPGRMASNKEIKDYLMRQGHGIRDVEDAMEWLKDGGYTRFGWERMESGSGRTTQAGSYARETMGRLHQKMNYKVPDRLLD